MKKISILSMLGIMSIGASYAGFHAAPDVNKKGGFVSGAENIVTVIQVNELRDDVPVIVKGKILQRTGDDKYLFADDTGNIIVEIDEEDWNGQNITSDDIIKLYGEVDRGIFKTEIDVKRVEKL